MKKALILGVTGQDGSYLADLLLEKGYEVHGLVRKSATGNLTNIRHLLDDKNICNKLFFTHRGDLLDTTSIYRIIAKINPVEIYNEADQDHVSWSYDMVGYSSDITASAVAKILEIILQLNPKIRFFQPCTSNMFGLSEELMQDENTPFNPQSPYAIAKTFAYYVTRYYRQTFGLHASVGILYNHESPRRTPEYVTRKISQSVARIALGKQEQLTLGDISAEIDWGYSPDYMDCAWRMIQADKAEDYIIATGNKHSVSDFVDEAFALVNLDRNDYLQTDQSLIRPTKTSVLVGNPTKAKENLGWEAKINFKELVRIMVEADLKLESNKNT